MSASPDLATVARCRNWHRKVNYARLVPRLLRVPIVFRAAPALFSLVLLVPSHAAAAENEDIAVLRRMLGELKRRTANFPNVSAPSRGHRRRGGPSPRRYTNIRRLL